MSNKSERQINKSSKSNMLKIILTLIVGIILLVIGSKNENIGKLLNFANIEETEIVNNDNIETQNLDGITVKCGKDVIQKITDNNGLKIYFFDVGQADSMLIVNNGKTMLIDAGNNEDGETIVNNIKKLGINKLDYVIGTHPHEDHIGGLDNVIKAFDIGKIYMPKVQTNTKTYEEVLDEISNKKLKITSPKIGDTFNVGNANCEVMSVGTDKSDLNLTSIVIRMCYNGKSYLFMGDAEKKNEDARNWPETDVIKVGHHGSSTSSSQKFLNQVKPKLAIIQVGEGNTYGHPHDAAMKRYEKLGTKIYRNDLNQDILIEQE